MRRILFCAYIDLMLILDGRKAREALVPALMAKIKAFGFAPTLAIIQVGDRADSASYIKAKKIFATKIGVTIKHIILSDNVGLKDIVEAVENCNKDNGIQGIVVQLPLPLGIDENVVINSISPKKDVDVITAVNVKKWSNTEHIEQVLFPATARGIKEMLEFYGISLKNKKVTVVGRSALVGRPIAIMCGKQGAIVKVCHRGTVDLAAETRSANIVISAAGVANLLGKEHIKSGQVIVDVGLSKNKEGILCGDVDFEAAKEVVSAISPVPGGVGPMTVLGLFENLLQLMASDRS